MQTHQDYLEAPYQARYEQEAFEERAADEFWPKESGKYAAEQTEHLLDDDRTESLVRRVALASGTHKSDEVLRGYGAELVEIIRAWCQENEHEINDRCIRRAESYRAESYR